MIFEYLISFFIGIAFYLFLPHRFSIRKRIAWGLAVFMLLSFLWTIFVMMAALAPLGGKTFPTLEQWEKEQKDDRVRISTFDK